MKKIFEVIILSGLFLAGCAKSGKDESDKKNKERENIENIIKSFIPNLINNFFNIFS